MSYRKKKTAGIVLCYGIIHDAVAGCTGTKSSTGNVVSSETETNAEETSARE